MIRVMTFNLRYDKPDLADFAWKIRKNAIASLITAYAPDLIGTQEGKAHQILDLHRLLPDYQSVGSDRTGTGIDEHCAIFYRFERWQCLKSDDFCLSDSPDVAGSVSDWGNLLPRMVSWAMLAAGENTVTIFNTHLDYKSAKARDLSVRLISDRLSNLNPNQSQVFLTGDFNAAPGTLPRQLLEQPLPNHLHLHDALNNLDLEAQFSFHDFTGKAFDAVDTIYYDSRLSLQNVVVDTRRWQGILPSDHFPIIADFRLV